jgi:ATP-dependent exoDNAse (exonuclease V) alpha subunit
MELTTGDRIRFGQLDEELGITNGTTGTVETLQMTAKGSAVITVRLDDEGRSIKVDTALYAIDHAYAVSVDRSQGATVEQTFFWASPERLNVHLGLVSATRSRGNFRMYVVEDDVEQIEQRLGVEQLRINAIEEKRWERASDMGLLP